MDDQQTHTGNAEAYGFGGTFTDFLNENLGIDPNLTPSLEAPTDNYAAGVANSYASFPMNYGAFATMAGDSSSRGPSNLSSTPEVVTTNMAHHSSSMFSFDSVSLATNYGSLNTGQFHAQNGLPGSISNLSVPAPQGNDNEIISNAAQPRPQQVHTQPGWQGAMFSQPYVTPEQNMGQPGNGGSPVPDGGFASVNTFIGNEFLPMNTPVTFNQMPPGSERSPPEAFITPDQGCGNSIAYTNGSAWPNNSNVNPPIQGGNVGVQNWAQTGFQSHNGNANFPLASNMGVQNHGQVGLQGHNGNTSMPLANNMAFQSQGQAGFQGRDGNNASSSPASNTGVQNQRHMGFPAQHGGSTNLNQVQHGIPPEAIRQTLSEAQSSEDAKARYATFLQQRGRDVLRNGPQTLPTIRPVTEAVQPHSTVQSRPPSETQGHRQIQQGGRPSSSIDHARLFPGMNAGIRPPGSGIPLKPLDTSTTSKVDLTGATPADPEYIARLFKASMEAAKSSELKKNDPKEDDEKNTGSKKKGPKKNGAKTGPKNGGGSDSRKKRTPTPGEATTKKPENTKSKRAAKQVDEINKDIVEASGPKPGGTLNPYYDSRVAGSGLNPSTGQNSIAPQNSNNGISAQGGSITLMNAMIMDAGAPQKQNMPMADSNRPIPRVPDAATIQNQMVMAMNSYGRAQPNQMPTQHQHAPISTIRPTQQAKPPQNHEDHTAARVVEGRIQNHFPGQGLVQVGLSQDSYQEFGTAQVATDDDGYNMALDTDDNGYNMAEDNLPAAQTPPVEGSVVPGGYPPFQISDDRAQIDQEALQKQAENTDSGATKPARGRKRKAPQAPQGKDKDPASNPKRKRSKKSPNPTPEPHTEKDAGAPAPKGAASSNGGTSQNSAAAFNAAPADHATPCVAAMLAQHAPATSDIEASQSGGVVANSMPDSTRLPPVGIIAVPSSITDSNAADPTSAHGISAEGERAEPEVRATDKLAVDAQCEIAPDDTPKSTSDLVNVLTTIACDQFAAELARGCISKARNKTRMVQDLRNQLIRANATTSELYVEQCVGILAKGEFRRANLWLDKVLGPLGNMPSERALMNEYGLEFWILERIQRESGLSDEEMRRQNLSLSRAEREILISAPLDGPPQHADMVEAANVHRTLNRLLPASLILKVQGASGFSQWVNSMSSEDGRYNALANHFIALDPET